MQARRPADDTRPIVLITGASSGIGRATTIEFARQRDAHLILAARRHAELEETAQLAARARPASSSPATVVLVACDLTDPDAVDALATRVHDSFGALDVLVNNAGMASAHAFDHPDSMRDADRMLALNLRTPIALTHALTPLLRASRSGTIVNVSSVAGIIGTPESDVYSATKWALTGFSEASRARLHHQGIRVVCVQPGPVPTPGWPHVRLRARPLLRGLLTAEVDEIAQLCVRAASRRGSVAPIRPRGYAVIPPLRAVAPWLLRSLLRRAALRRARALTPRTTDQETTR